MEKIGAFLPKQPEKPKRKTNQHWLLAAKVGNFTGDKPNRWLGICKRYPWEVNRALNYLADKPNIHNKARYFTWLVYDYVNKAKLSG